MTQLIAHRGASTELRENTLPAFKLAEDLGADMIELDIQISKDGRCVVLHDKDLNRLWNVDATVHDLTYDEIRGVTSSDEHQAIPLLDDVLQEIHIPIMIDVDGPEAILPIVQLLLKMDCVEQALFSGGRLQVHRLLRQHLPDVSTALTWNHSTLPDDELLTQLHPRYFNPPWWLLLPGVDKLQTLGPETVAYMHDREIHTSTWTVDDIPIVEALILMGVDAVISNRCREVVSWFRNGPARTTE